MCQIFFVTYANVLRYEFIMASIMINDSGMKKTLHIEI